MYQRTAPTNWDKYHHNNPTNFFVKWFFLDVMVKAYNRLLAHAQIPANSSILELGSGTGYVTKELICSLQSTSATLVDFNQGMLDISENTFSGTSIKTTFIQSDFFNLNISAKFNLVHSGGVIEHFEPSKQLELVKIHANFLKSNGYCIIFVPTPTSSYRFFRRFAEILGVWKYTDEVPMTEEELIAVVEKSGLKVLASTYFWKSYYLSEVGVLAQKI